VHQMSEIYPVKGVRIVGPLPAELQLVTTYTAAVLQGTQNEAVARRFVQFMAGPAGRAGVAAAGLDPPR
jgi:molybdate transport system substrate-binding protein